MSAEQRDDAKRLLVHYFKTAFVAAGLAWDDWDNTAEVESIVDAIADATRAPDREATA